MPLHIFYSGLVFKIMHLSERNTRIMINNYSEYIKVPICYDILTYGLLCAIINWKSAMHYGGIAEIKMESRDIFERRSVVGMPTKANSIQDYYNIPPDEVAKQVFDDAMVLFSIETGVVISSRAPAALFVPGENICRYADVLATVESTAPCGEIFGAQRYKCADLPRQSRRLGLEDTFYLRRSCTQPGMALAFFAVHRAGLGRVPDVRSPYPSTIPNWSGIAADIINVGSPYNRNTFYTQIAEMTRRISAAVGSGVALNDRCRDFMTFDNFNTYAYLAVILALVMFFRRNAMRRGFNMTICSPSKSLLQPYFVFSAELYNGSEFSAPNELDAIADIALSRGLDFEYGITAQKKIRGVHIYFSPFVPDVSTEDLKNHGVWNEKKRADSDWSDAESVDDVY